tara:strand:+ start:1645 stop:2256 length:612 start_codon:yes stop_codon:yes gene_type:complete
MKKISLQFILIILIIFNNFFILNADEQNYKIIKLINDQIITNYDLEQRLKLYSALNSVDINKENIDRLASEMLHLMVDEKLQIEQINKFEISIDKSEVDDYIKRAFLKDDKSLKDLNDALLKNNIDIAILNKSIEIMIGWNELTYRLYYRTSEVNNLDLENKMSEDSALSKEKARNMLIQKQINLRAKKFLRDLRIEANIENR